MNQAVNMKSFNKTVLYLIIAIVSQCKTTTTTTTTTTAATTTSTTTAATTTSATKTTTALTAKPEESSNDLYNLFAADLFSVITEGKSSENIVYSPAAIQTCMALTFIGAEGETAAEMRKVLRLGEDDKLQIASRFRKFLQINPKTNNLTSESPKLNMINRFYVNQQLEVSQEFNKIALAYFDTQAEQVNFNDSKTVVEYINQWVAQQTEDKIKDILKEDAVISETNALLINAIYFKGKWLNAFSKSSTSMSRFYINKIVSQPAEIMYNEEYYGYAKLPELEATALEMPYNNSDISMLIILPNKIDGLQKLELQLRNKDLSEITSKIMLKKVHAYVPKFKLEFEIDLKEPLEKMGLETTFSSKANFKSIFTTSASQSISEVKHKAFLDVNEAGSEAAATTFVTLTNLSGFFGNEIIFRADHPFIFAIHSKSVVYFAGHVAII